MKVKICNKKCNNKQMKKHKYLILNNNLSNRHNKLSIYHKKSKIKKIVVIKRSQFSKRKREILKQDKAKT